MRIFFFFIYKSNILFFRHVAFWKTKQYIMCNWLLRRTNRVLYKWDKLKMHVDITYRLLGNTADSSCRDRKPLADRWDSRRALPPAPSCPETRRRLQTPGNYRRPWRPRRRPSPATRRMLRLSGGDSSARTYWPCLIIAPVTRTIRDNTNRTKSQIIIIITKR